MNIAANCEGIALGRTLGIAHLGVGGLRAMRRDCGARVALHGVGTESRSAYNDIDGICDEMRFAPGRRVARAQALCRAAGRWLGVGGTSLSVSPNGRPRAWKGSNVEFLFHHFQRPLSPLPYVVVCHDLHIYDIPWKYPNLDAMKENFLQTMRGAAAILAPYPSPFRRLPDVSPESAEKVFRFLGPPLLCDVPLEPDRVEAMRERYRPDPSVDLLLYPGQLQAHKNHKRLLDALGILRKDGLDIRLLCPGSEYREEITADIMAHVRELGLEEAVSFPGFIDAEDLRAAYEICSAAVSPSFAEGGNMICQEAIAFGRPVACADTEASRALLDEIGADVPVFDPNDVDAMARSVGGVLADRDARVSANRNARETMSSWTWERVARRWMDVLEWVEGGCADDERPRQEAG